MKTLSTLSLFVVLSLCATCMAQDNTEASMGKEHYKHALGVAAGLTTGYGLSYRYYIHRFAFQLTFAPYSRKDNYSVYTNKELRLNTGLGFLFNLVEGEKSNLFLYQSNYLYYSKFSSTRGGLYPGTNESTENYFNNGLGLGIEFIIVKKASLNFQAGYAGYHNFETIDFTGELGLFYKF